MLEAKDVARLRRQLNLSQSELARMSGLSESLIAKIESGKVDPPYSKMKVLIETLQRLQRRTTRKVKEVMSKDVMSVQAKDKVRDATALMRKHAISQLPVFDGDRIVGSISEKTILTWLSEKEGPEKLFQRRVKEVMDDPFPTVVEDTPIELIYPMLTFYPAVLVARKDKVVGIVTKADLLKES